MDAGGRSEERDDHVEDRGGEVGGGPAAARLTPRFSASTASRYDVSVQAEEELLA